MLVRIDTIEDGVVEGYMYKNSGGGFDKVIIEHDVVLLQDADDADDDSDSYEGNTRIHVHDIPKMIKALKAAYKQVTTGEVI